MKIKIKNIFYYMDGKWKSYLEKKSKNIYFNYSINKQTNILYYII